MNSDNSRHMDTMFAELINWIEGARNEAIKNIIVSAFVIVAAFASHSLGKRAISRAFDHASDRAAARSEARAAAKFGAQPDSIHCAKAPVARRKFAMARSIALGVYRYAILAVAVVWILSLFGVNLASMLAVAGVGGLAIGIGAQNLVRDVINGMLIWFEDQYAVGDEVTIGLISGKVEDFSLRATRVRRPDGQLCTIPNSSVSIVANGSKGFRRAIVDVGIPEGVDVIVAIRALRSAFSGKYGAGASEGVESGGEANGKANGDANSGEANGDDAFLRGLIEDVAVEGVKSFYAGVDASKGALVRVSARCKPEAYASVEMEIRLRAIKALDALVHEKRSDV